MIGERRAVDDLHQVIKDARFRPQLLVQAAMALGKLGDAGFVRLSVVVDRRSPFDEPLTEMLLDTDQSALPRAFAAAALGGICDRRRCSVSGCVVG
ncbi:MAG: hypothetical protein ACI89X_001021 [Planctomycetota bacterium]